MKLVSGIEAPNNELEVDFILRDQHPCHYACKEGNLGLLNFVVNQPFDQALFKEDGVIGWNPAHWAVYFKKHQALAFLHNYSSSLIKSRTMHYCQSTLHLAAGVGDHEAVKWLLSQGSDPNAKDSLGETPLHKAARNGSEACLSLLLAAQADTSLLNTNAQNAYELASMCGHFPAATLLQNAQLYQVGVKRKLDLETDVQVKRFCADKENVPVVAPEVVKMVVDDKLVVMEDVGEGSSKESQVKVVESSVVCSQVLDPLVEPVVRDTSYQCTQVNQRSPHEFSHYRRTYEINRYDYHNNSLSMGHFF